MSELQTSCDNGNFSQITQCLRPKATATYAGYENQDLMQVYLAWMDAAAERVRNGQMSEQEARLGAAELYSRLKSEQTERIYAANADWQMRYQGFLAGLATYNAIENQPQPSPTIITCVGQIATVCY